VVTAGFKHSSAGEEQSMIVRNLQNVSHSWARYGQRELTPFAPPHNNWFSLNIPLCDPGRLLG